MRDSNMRRREFIKLIGGAAVTWPLSARAQQATKTPRIGVLTPGRPDNSDPNLSTLNAFIAALRELGYTEGQNIAIERKFGEGDADRLRRLATELVEIPIVAIAMANPVPDELVANVARPGGNVTGLTFLVPDIVA